MFIGCRFRAPWSPSWLSFGCHGQAEICWISLISARKDLVDIVRAHLGSARNSRRLLAVGCFTIPSASACDRSKRRRFGCRRTAKLRELTCASCLSEAPWRGESLAARRRLLWPQVAPKDSLREAFGDAGCRARFFAYFLLGRHTGRAIRK